MSRQIEVSDETFEKIKDQLSDEDIKELDSMEDLVGGKYLFRTVTYHMVGRVEKIVGKFAYLKDSSWVADSGRFHDFIKDGVNDSSEIEPVGDSYVNLEAVADFFPWKHSLKLKQK